MTTWTDNLEIPHLDQNVAEPEVPENVAKDILDDVFAGMYSTAMTDANYTYVYIPDPKLAQPWHNFVQEFTGTLTAERTITFPANNRPYLLMNNTNYTIHFIAASSTADAIPLAVGATMYIYSDGTDLLKIPFDVPTEQVVTSTSNAMTIDLDKGSHVYYAAIETTTITITSSYASTSFKMMVNNGSTYTPTFSSVAWAGSNAPGWSTGNDLVEFTMINSIWVGHAIALNVS